MLNPSAADLEAKDKDSPAIPREVRCTPCHLYCRCLIYSQSKDDRKPLETVCKDIQDADKKMSTVRSLSGPTETAVNTIDFANAAMTHLDTISDVYLRPFRTFNMVVDGIANVCLPD